MRTSTNTAAILLSLAVLAGLSGCLVAAGAAVGVGAAAYVGGDLEGRLEASPERIVQASESALKEMDIHVVSADASGIDGKVIARTAMDKKIEITVNRDGDSSSTIAIRVDTFGDETLSRQVYDKIRSKLG